MLNLQEFRSQEEGYADRLNYDAIIKDGVMICKDGALLASWFFRGPDLASSTSDELASISARINNSMRFGNGWMIHIDEIRREAPGYPSNSKFPDRTTKVIDEERRMQFLAEGAHYESIFSLSLTYLPPSARESKATEMLFEGEDDDTANKDTYSQHVAKFCIIANDFEDQLGSSFIMKRMGLYEYIDSFGVKHLRDDMLQFLHYCATGDNHAINLPEIPAYLDTIIGNADFYGGIKPRINDKHIRVVAIDGYPQKSYPAILSALEELAIEFRWSTRFHFLDTSTAVPLLDGIRKKWKQKVRGFKDQVFQSSSGAVNLDAAGMTTDAEVAMGEAESNQVRFGFLSSNIILSNTDKHSVEQAEQEVKKIINNMGFVTRSETINAVEAFLGSLPGHGVENIRRKIQHSLNLADLMPSTAVWAGMDKHPCPFYPENSPPLLYAATNGATPFRLNTHLSDVGHCLVLGPTGSGKTTLLGLMVAQQFRYPDAQVFAFDLKYGLYGLTMASGGDHYDLGREESKLSFCPLQFIDDRSDFIWAIEWLETLCGLQGLTITAELRQKLGSGLELLKGSPTRTITEFCANVQDMQIRQALSHYTISGPMGSLLDSETDSLSTSKFMTFEMEELMEMGDKNVIPVLLYLFRRIEKRLDGSPTVIPLDEAWVSLGHPLFEKKLRSWLKLLRSKNCAVWMFSQSLSDIANSPIRDVIFESTPTKILLANPEAKTENFTPLYRALGLNDRQISIIANATPKRHYYYLSTVGRRLFQLGLGGVALAFVGVSGKEDVKLIKKFIEEFGQAWPAEWLKYRGLNDWAKYWLELNAES